MAWLVGLSGAGEVTTENATALLDDWLPMEGVSLAFGKLPRSAKSMRAIKKWAEEEEIDVVDDAGDDLVDRLVRARKDGDEVYLVLAWDDAESSSKLLEQATEADIQVKDLTRALDDLEFEDDDGTGDTLDEAVAAEADTSGTESSETASVEPDNGDDGPPWDTSGEVSSAVQPDKVVTANVVGPATLAPDAGLVSVGLRTQVLAQALESVVRDIVREEVARLLEKPETESVGVLVDPDGNYRLAAKGRPKKGETATKVTPTVARELGLIE